MVGPKKKQGPEVTELRGWLVPSSEWMLAGAPLASMDRTPWRVLVLAMYLIEHEVRTETEVFLVPGNENPATCFCAVRDPCPQILPSSRTFRFLPPISSACRPLATSKNRLYQAELTKLAKQKVNRDSAGSKNNLKNVYHQITTTGSCRLLMLETTHGL